MGKFQKNSNASENCHAQDIGDGGVFEGDLQGLAVVARSLADLASYGNVGQELHLYFYVAVSGAGFATASLDVEGEPSRLITPRPRFRHRGEQLSDRSEGSDVGCGIAAGGPSNGRLVYVDHFVHGLYSIQAVALSGAVFRPVEQLRQLLKEDLIDQGGLAGAGYAGNHDKLAKRDIHIDVLEVVFTRSLYGDAVSVAGTPQKRQRYLTSTAQVGARHRFIRGADIVQPASSDDSSAVFTGAGAEVYDVVRGPHYGLVVFHNEHGIAEVTEMFESGNQPGIVGRMQAYGRFVADVENTGEAGAYLRSQPDTLSFSTRQSRGRAVQGYVVQADVQKELQPGLDFLEYLISNGVLPLGERVCGGRLCSLVTGGGAHPFMGLAHRLSGYLHYALSGHRNGQRFRL